MKPRHADPRGRILAIIRASTQERGYPPTMREIADGCGFASTSSVAHHLKAMADDGLIRRVAGRPRALVIADIHPNSGAGPVAPEPAPDPHEGDHLT